MKKELNERRNHIINAWILGYAPSVEPEGLADREIKEIWLYATQLSAAYKMFFSWNQRSTCYIYPLFMMGIACFALVNGCTFINTDCTLKCVCRNDQINCNTNFRCSPYAECREDDGIRGCYCNEGFKGDGETCTPLYRDCYDVYEAGITADGVYSILPAGWPGEPFSVLCNMTSDGGGWTVFQRRIDSVTDFYRNWASYKNGFGSLESDFWLGNEQLHYLTKQKVYQLRIDMVTSQDSSLLQTYPEFAVGNESVNYKMILDRGNARTGLYFNTGRSFSTYDRDNDRCSVYNCAVQHRGGWWYGGASSWCHSCYGSHCSNIYVNGCSTACTDSNLNGDYNGGNGQTIIWYRNAAGRYCSMKYADMKIRPVT
ncbi:Ryncolin-4 [Holothuria leucospilota]|uniref:Ryncolin-4 n=1 Tax=Holothuria leucospilota TaxID=206669 RepID=A0A9Q1BWD6_HOLLE|nr:Ryncolin-4 [Holothuria leucospilota]